MIASGILANYRVAKFLNLSYGSLYALGAYICYFTGNMALGVFFSAISGILAGIVLFVLIRHLSENLVESSIISLGFGIILEEILRNSHKTSYFLLVSVESAYLSLAGEAISIWYVAIAMFTAIFYLAIVFLFKTKYGTGVKIIEEDEELAEIYGFDTEKFKMATIALTSLTAAVTGCLISPTTALNPYMGFPILIAGILIASVSRLFGEVGFKNYIYILMISLVYSNLLGFFGGIYEGL